MSNTRYDLVIAVATNSIFSHHQASANDSKINQIKNEGKHVQFNQSNNESLTKKIKI